jgi:DNA-binding transcriptional LysR family regulator
VVNHALVVRRLTQSRDDLMIMSQVPQDLALDFMPFLENPIIAVAPPDHPLCEADSLQLQDLTTYPLLIRESGSGTRRACEEYCDQ